MNTGLPNCELQFWSSQLEKFLANSSQKSEEFASHRFSIVVLKLGLWCVFITAGPSTKLFTWGGGGISVSKIPVWNGSFFFMNKRP
jgi:hypothetical protein